jgi:hypothetical protein
MNKLILTIIGVVGLTTISWGQFWQPPQTLTMPSMSFTTPSGSFDPSQVTYTLESQNSPTTLEPYDYSNSYQNVGYIGSDGSRIAFNLNMVGSSPEHNIMVFGPNMSWGVRLNSPSTGSPVTDPLATSFENLAPIPWNPGMSAGVSLSTPLTPELWATVSGGGSGSGGGEGNVISEQAAHLNIGLEFNNGQWTPAQN